MKSITETTIEKNSPNPAERKGPKQAQMIRAIAGLLAVVAAPFLLSGCAATQIALEHRNLNVQTRMSQTVFLDAEKPADRTVLLDVKNTSDKPIQVDGQIRQRLEAKGYRIVTSPAEAYYILQVNVLQVGKQDPSALRQSTYSPYDSTEAGVATGAAIGSAAGGFDASAYGGVIGGVAAGGAELIAGALVHNVTYRMITDLQILERTDEKVSQTVNSDLQQGSGTHVFQTSQSTRERRKYQTQIVSTANRVNLRFDKALQVLEDNLAQSIAGIL